MKFSRIFREASRFWPESIDISDGHLQGERGGYFQHLSELCRVAEDQAEHWSEWHQVMVWAIFCGLHRLAVDQLYVGCKFIRKAEVDMRYVEFKFSESVFALAPSYPRQIRRAYVNDLR